LLYAQAVSEQSSSRLRKALEARFFLHDVDLEVDLAALRGDPELAGLLAEHGPSG